MKGRNVTLFITYIRDGDNIYMAREMIDPICLEMSRSLWWSGLHAPYMGRIIWWSVPPTLVCLVLNYNLFKHLRFFFFHSLASSEHSDYTHDFNFTVIINVHLIKCVISLFGCEFISPSHEGVTEMVTVNITFLV